MSKPIINVFDRNLFDLCMYVRLCHAFHGFNTTSYFCSVLFFNCVLLFVVISFVFVRLFCFP